MSGLRRCLAAVVTAAALVGCTSSSPTAEGSSTTTATLYEDGGRVTDDAGLVPLADWNARQDAFLQKATATPMDPTKPVSLMAYGARARRDPTFKADLLAATPATFAKALGENADDDFAASTLLTLYINNKDRLDPALAAAIKKWLLDFKYWWTEPQKPGVIDRQYYWTENHQIIFLADEYLAGQAFPDETFSNSAMTGKDHMAHALPLFKRWVELRAKYGYSEFLSNPYTAMTSMGILSLADLADDPAVSTLASMALDMLLVEVASNLHDNVLGSTHGRSYTGNLVNGRSGTTGSLIKLVFSSDEPETGSSPTAAMAVANRYRPPEVARRIAATKEIGVTRQHAGLPLDPTTPVTANPVPPDGLAFKGDDGLMVWWSMGAQLSWQVVPLSVETIEKYNLWNTPNFKIAGADVLEGVVKSSTPEALVKLSHDLGAWLNPGLLSEVNTYTWRSPDAMLSTAQDWRAGQRTEYSLISQATLGGTASVFTTHPKGLPDEGDKPGSQGGYWSGDGAAPRAAQHGDTTMLIYSPQYANSGVEGPNGFQPYTHAYFPTERFDQILERDGWTFGRKGDGYVALWSWRPTHWNEPDFSQKQIGDFTKKFELIADGGPDNVWINRVGRAADYAGAADPFVAFADAVTKERPIVAPMGGATPCPAGTPTESTTCVHAVGDGFLVTYRSPGRNELGFGWSPKATNPLPPLTDNATPVALNDPTKRWDSPWGSAARDGRYHAAADGWTLDLDFNTSTRRSGRP